MSEAAERAFFLEGFRDYLALEAGHSPHTVENYLRDLRRLVQFAESKRVKGPGGVNRGLLRDFIFMLKDLGLSSATIRRQVSALHTYFGFLVGEAHLADDPSDRLETPKKGRPLPAGPPAARGPRGRGPRSPPPAPTSRSPGATARCSSWGMARGSGSPSSAPSRSATSCSPKAWGGGSGRGARSDWSRSGGRASGRSRCTSTPTARCSIAATAEGACSSTPGGPRFPAWGRGASSSG